MFGFGREDHFSEHSSKQLWHNAAMQWWIINLEDGFNKSVPGKFVKLEDIVSIPMLALWDGMVAVPWQGPPPVDARGFMSVLIQATANPALDPAIGSPYFNRNYFMISKNFCSLTSRFGFHFSTVEALVGERTLENYVSFAFKGGAADQVRKARRVKFIAYFLEEAGFRVEVTDDNLFARIEGRSQDYMEERLRILGYLIMHTRQLDMVMSNEAEVRRYRAKFVADIQGLLGIAISLDPTAG
jgi:pyruvate,water dikinase